MLELIAFALLGQAPTMSAEEIVRRLEAPISLRTDPSRLPVVLDMIGAKVGVRIRCEAELQPAVVVVGVAGKPAKEVVDHLMKGIGAASLIQNGTMHIGIRIATEQQAGQQRELEIKAIKSTLDARANQLKIDEPIDPQLAPRTAAQALLALQNPNGEVRVPYQLFWEANTKSPIARASAGLLRAIGPELLRLDEERTKVITIESLDRRGQVRATEVLAKLSTEQAAWSDAFQSVLKLANANSYSNVSEELLNRSAPIRATPPNGFKVTIVPNAWGRNLMVEVLSNGDTLFETSESIPKQRVYTDPGGTPYSISNAATISVPLTGNALRLAEYRTPFADGRPKPYDRQLMKLLADPWRNEPASFTRAQPMADVAAKLGLNIVAYMGDQVMYHFAYQNPVQNEGLSGHTVLQFAAYGTSGLRKKGDWLIAYTSNPEQYLDSQVDRIALGKFLTLALRPGALTFDQFLAARKEMGSAQLEVAKQIARIVQPGFDSLNPIQIQLLEILADLKPGQLAMASNVGIPYSSLPIEIQTKARQFVGYQRRKGVGIVDDSLESAPTIDDVRRSRVFIERTSKYGVLSLQGTKGRELGSPRDVYYNFHDYEQFRGASLAANVLQTFQDRNVWNARLDTITFRLEIKRKNAQMFGTNQYITDITVLPLTDNQLIQSIGRYLGSD